MDESTTGFKTHIQIANDLIAKDPSFYKSLSGEDGALSFAKYLDSFQELTGPLEKLAMEHASKIDREVLLALFEALPKDQAQNIVRSIMSRHRHHKVATDENGSHV